MTVFYNQVLNDEERARLVSNIAGHLKDAKDFIQKRAVSTVLFSLFGMLPYQENAAATRAYCTATYKINGWQMYSISVQLGIVHSCRIKFLDHMWFHSRFLASQ